MTDPGTAPDPGQPTGTDPPVIDLSAASGHRVAWDRPAWVVASWRLCELLAVRNPFQPSSAIRAAVLRAFGARIGSRVILRPGLRVQFPWKLRIGDRSWVGEDVWLHNQDQLDIGSDVVLSQQSFVTTGSHAHRTDMGLRTRPVVIENGVWVTARCTVLAGTRLGRSALVLPASVVSGTVPAGVIVGQGRSAVIGPRFIPTRPGAPDDRGSTQPEQADRDRQHR